MTIYLDVLFIKEFLINFAIIYSTNKILQQKSKLLLTFLGGIMGASYTILCLMFPGKYIYIGRIICVALIVFITSNSQTTQNYFKAFLTFYIVTFFISGIYLYTYGEQIKSYLYIIISIMLISEIIKSYIEKYKISNYICDLEIHVENKIIKMKALIDTGHSLISNSNEEVIVISPKILKKIKDKKMEDILVKSKLDEMNKYINQIRFIPYKVLDNKSGFRYGIKIMNAKVCFNEKIYSKESVIISSNINFDEYDAIIGLNFIKGGESNGNLINNEGKGKKVICTSFNYIGH